MKKINILQGTAISKDHCYDTILLDALWQQGEGKGEPKSGWPQSQWEKKIQPTNLPTQHRASEKSRYSKVAQLSSLQQKSFSQNLSLPARRHLKSGHTDDMTSLFKHISCSTCLRTSNWIYYQLHQHSLFWKTSKVFHSLVSQKLKRSHVHLALGEAT